MRFLSFLFIIIFNFSALFSALPNNSEIQDFAQQEMKVSLEIISICKDEKEIQFQWGRVSGLYDIIRYNESGNSISYSGNPSRKD